MTDAQDVPARQLWAKVRGEPLAGLAPSRAAVLRAGEPVTVIGGKLAAALIDPLQSAGFPLSLSDRRHPILAEIPPEDPEYETFGHGYGEVYSAREFRQLVERAARTFSPQEDRWRRDGRIVDPFRPRLRYSAVTDQEFDVLQERHLNAVRGALRRAGAVVVSLSQSEVWESKVDGAVFPHWTSAAEQFFDPEKHFVRSLTVEETILDLLAAIAALRELNPSLTVALMVSPEPQLATTYATHVLSAGTIGKAVLRIAMEAIAGTEAVTYVPAFEIAMLSTAAQVHGADGTPPKALVDAVLMALTSGSADEEATSPVPVLRTMPSEPRPARRQKPAAPATEAAVEEAAAPPGRVRKKDKPKPSAISVVDPYTQAKADEAKARAERRAAHLASMGQTATAEAEPEEPKPSYAEKQVLKRERALAREARLAAAAAAEATSRATATTPTTASEGAAPEKARRKMKGAAGEPDQNAGPAEKREDTPPKPARERKRDARG